ncbi:hypothetical protein HMPREF1545_03387 [Oscillibacter sp. KLE 1728]|nr:hypothetical protein HMPREF1545_03387 [Oscillibacter sp. KLE 1728]ERK64759.1 hypothetical protein HMPREF1546_01616 [Oscillibacter sp. KLE 1745]
MRLRAREEGSGCPPSNARHCRPRSTVGQKFPGQGGKRLHPGIWMEPQWFAGINLTA